MTVAEMNTTAQHGAGSVEAYARLFDLAREPMLVAGADGLLRELNGAAAELLGEPVERLAGRPLADLLHPEDRAALAQQWGALKRGLPLACELRLLLPEGEARRFEWRLAALADGAVALAVNDLLPARRVLEKMLRQEAAGMGDGFWVWDLAAGRVHGSDEAYALLGLPPRCESPGAAELLAALHPEDAGPTRERIEALIERGGPERDRLELRVLRPDGRTRRLRARLTVHRDGEGRALRLLGAVCDVTDEPRVRAELKRDRELTDAVFENSAGLLLVVDREGRVVRFNRAAERVSGYAAADVVGRAFWELFFPRHESGGMRTLFESLEAGPGDEMFTTEWLVRDGRRVPITWSHAIIRDEAGNPAYTVCLGFEVGELRQARRRLLELEENYRRLVELSFDLVVVQSEGVIVELNQRGAQMLGATPADFVGRPILELFAPECRESVAERLRGAHLANIATPLVERRLLRPDGRQVEVEGVAIPIRWQGRPGTQAVYRDITLRKEAERALREREQFFHTLARATPVGVFQTDGEGRFTYVNERFLQITGLSLRGTLGDEWQSHLHPEEREAVVSGLREALAAKRRFDTELRLRRPDGATLWVRLLAAPEAESPGAGYIGSILDITGAKRNEEELRRYRGQLEEMVARRTAELEAVNSELEAFAYSVTHDLRAPLRAINGFGQALEEEYGSGLDAQANYYLRRIRNNSKFMGELIEDLLELSRVSQHELIREPVDLAELARAVLADLRLLEPARQVEFCHEGALVVEADASLLRVLMRNLLENAWKYTGTRPLARIRLGAGTQAGEPIFFVEDNGIGFDMSCAESLFRAFHRLHTAKEFEGTGIGLATVQRVVNRHGGRLWAEGEEGRGATFFFTLGAPPAT